jgi:hypothetical protein
MEDTVPIHLAVEDSLSETVLRVMLMQCGRNFAVGSCYCRGGYGYLKTKIGGFNQAAKGTAFLVLTDLNAYPCPPALIADWLRVPKHPNLLLRVAVREVESWVLADRQAFARFLGVPARFIPNHTDAAPDPKALLIDLARRSRNRERREAIVPRPGSTAKQGRDYNGELIRFVETQWSLGNAVKISSSLKRAVDALSAFRVKWL